MSTIESVEEMSRDLKIILLKKGIFQKDLAVVLGIHSALLNQFINGRTRLKKNTVLKFCNEVGISFKALEVGKVRELRQGEVNVDPSKDTTDAQST